MEKTCPTYQSLVLPHFMLLCCATLVQLQSVPASEQLFILALDLLNSLTGNEQDESVEGRWKDSILAQTLNVLADLQDEERRDRLQAMLSVKKSNTI